MRRVRSIFTRNSEQYSRFPLQPEEEREGHVEVKLTDDGATEDAGHSGGSPCTGPPAQPLSRRLICCWVAGTLVLFFVGFGFGSINHHNSQQEAVSCGTKQEVETTTEAIQTTKAVQTTKASAGPAEAVKVAEPQLDWSDITRLLTEKLTKENFTNALSTFSLASRPAGSAEDNKLAEKIYKQFKDLEMEPWTDIHYVQLQKQDSNRSNRVVFDSETFLPKGYLAYSPNRKVEGKVVYGNFGRPEDLKVLLEKNILLQGCVLLLRAGYISFAQKVANAAEKGAMAVLIYPDNKGNRPDTELYGHVHLGSGDPYTPGFPSFNHTQFPPTQSSGLPTIPAQSITDSMAATILQKIGGPDAGDDFKGNLSVSYRLGGEVNVTVEVNNVLVNTEIHNVFGVIKGFVDPDRYVVLGAQRDAWGRGYARASVGTTILTELAKAVHQMVEEDGFRPRRSLVFASWSAGEFGSVGATEWLEGYMPSIHQKALTYISLDGAVMGRGGFMASASPLLHQLLENTMKEVNSNFNPGSLYSVMGGDKWETNVLRPMAMDDPAYPFLAFAGIPSVSFHFINPRFEMYPYYGTSLDTKDHLDYQTGHHTGEMVAVAGQFAGQMALRLVHDHLLHMDVNRYGNVLTRAVVPLYKLVHQLSQSGQLKGVDPKWINRARGSFMRAAAAINRDISSTDFTDQEACRILNDRIMKVEHGLLSPYVSPKETPFRHILLGQGAHTLAAISETNDMKELHTQLGLATWTLQGCANAMAGDIWDIDNEI